MPLMTPMVREAIALLALSKLEVAALVTERLATNPWLVVQPELPFASPAPTECELIVRRLRSGYAVCLNPHGLLPVRVKPLSVQDQASKAARRLHNEAVWLVRGLAYREKILHRVADAVVQCQAACLDQGPTRLKPLTLRQVAEWVTLHPSTVSRVTANKTLFIEHGHYAGQMLTLRALLTARPRTEAVKHAVAALIEEEATAGTRPLSDERIAALLRDRGYRVARRTVAQYRATLGIGHAYRRRRL